jgi:glycerol-3-phosphate acyltransferase PlsY
VISAIVFIAIAYVLGSIPTGYWVAKSRGIDITKVGSGSTGATNVYRCCGKAAGIFVFVIDILKGYLPVLIASILDQGDKAQEWSFIYPHLVPTLVALSTLIGHSKSVFLGFKGGKSAATGLGTLLALQPLAALCTFATWISLVYLTRIVSLASIAAVAASVGYFALFKAPLAFTGYCAVGFVYITWRHKANIQRMLAGTEPRVGDKPKELAEPEKSKQTTEASSDKSKD